LPCHQYGVGSDRPARAHGWPPPWSTRVTLTARPGYNAADDALVTAVELHALNGVPAPDTPAGESDSWHGIVDTTHIRQELGLRPYHPSV
jgi:hypothetical protein